MSSYSIDYGNPNMTPLPTPATSPSVAGAMTTGQYAAGSQLPGYATSIGNIGGNIASETAGNVPDDVKYQLAQAAAERGVATGNPGGANTNADYLRSLGLTSLGLTQTGQQNFQNILPSLPGYTLSQNPAYYENVGQSLNQQNIATERQNQLTDQTTAQQLAQQQAAAQNKAAQAGYASGASSYSPPTPPPSLLPAYNANAFGGDVNPPAVGAINYGGSSFSNPDSSYDPYAAWSQQNPWASIASKYSDTVTGGADQSAGTEDFGTPDQSAEEASYYASPEYADLSGGA